MQANDQAHVERCQDARQQAIDQRAVDNDVDIVEAVTENGEGDCQWDDDHGQEIAGFREQKTERVGLRESGVESADDE